MAGVSELTIRQYGDPVLKERTRDVEDIDGALVELKAKGVKLRDETPRTGHAGSRIAFLDPASTGGVLIELAELAPGH